MFVKEMYHVLVTCSAGLTKLTAFFRVLEIGVIAIIDNPGSLCVTRDITRVNYREHMRRSLGLKIC